MMLPHADVIWAAIIAASVAAIGWAVTQAVSARNMSQRLADHIDECDKRARTNEALLARIDHRVDELYKMITWLCRGEKYESHKP
jgi:hypothetical protein